MKTRYLVLITITLCLMFTQNIAIGVGSNKYGYTIDVYMLDTTNMFAKFGDIYVLKDQFVYQGNFTTVDWIVDRQTTVLNDWNSNGHPYLQGFTLDSDVGNYTNNYFWHKFRGDLYSFFKELGYRELYVNVFGNVIEVSIGYGETPDAILDNVNGIGDIYMNLIGKMLTALKNEGFYLPFDKFLEGIGNRIKVVIITTPFKRYTDNFMLDEAKISMTYPSDIYQKYGFMIQSIGPETIMGVYSIEIPLACKDPSIGIEYNLSSIQDILPEIREVKNILFGEDKEVIVIPTRKCYTGDPFQNENSDNVDRTHMEMPVIRPIKIKEVNAVYALNEAGGRDNVSNEYINEYGDVEKSNSILTYNPTLFLSMLIISVVSLVIYLVVKRLF